MLPCVWPALNHTFHPCNIYRDCPRGLPGRPKCAKMANFWTYGLNYWERLKIDGYTCCDAFHKHWILFSSMWHLPRLSQGRTQGRPKCALGWLQKLTHVPLAIVILLVTYFNDCDHSSLSDNMFLLWNHVSISTMSLKFRLFSLLSRNKTKPTETATFSHGLGTISPKSEVPVPL